MSKPRVALVNFNHAFNGGMVVWPDMRDTTWRPNYGDMFVCAALIRQLGFKEVTRIGFGATLKDSVDLAVIRGSTYLHGKFDFEAAIKTVESLNCPVAVVGLGAQHSEIDPTFLDSNNQARRFVELLAERSASIAVRGNFSAEVALRLGAQNVRVCGCPSAFYQPGSPNVEVLPTLLHKDRRIGISIHSSLRKSIFCRDPEAVAAKHGRVIIHALKNSSSVQMFEQGSAQDFLVSDRGTLFERRRDAAQALLERVKIADFLTPEELMCRFASIRSVEEWLSKARDCDAFLGFRFHGNMVALSQGIPCFFFVYDSRIQEFCDLYRLPHQKIEDAWTDPFTRIFDHAWDDTNKALKQCKDELGRFWAENDIEVAF